MHEILCPISILWDIHTYIRSVSIEGIDCYIQAEKIGAHTLNEYENIHKNLLIQNALRKGKIRQSLHNTLNGRNPIRK